MKAEYVCVVIDDGEYFTWQTSGRTAFWIIAKEYAMFEWLTPKDLGSECLLNAYKGHHIFVAPLNKKARRLIKERKNLIGDLAHWSVPMPSKNRVRKSSR